MKVYVIGEEERPKKLNTLGMNRGDVGIDDDGCYLLRLQDGGFCELNTNKYYTKDLDVPIDRILPKGTELRLVIE